MKNREERTYQFDVELRESEDGKTMQGHASVFNEEANIGGMFREVVKPGSFKNTIKVDDVRALFNHDSNHVLGRNIAGTLKMKEDSKGLAVTIIPPDTQTARDLAISMERGDINQMSIGFQVISDRIVEDDESKLPLREIQEVKLFDVSPVTFPAFVGTDIAMRSIEVHRSTRTVNNKYRCKAKIKKIQADIYKEEYVNT